MRALLVVDLQEEFKDKDGVYNDILKWVKCQKEIGLYDMIIATQCGNSLSSPFYKYTGWDAMLDGNVKKLPFDSDYVIYKDTYGLSCEDFDLLPMGYVYDIVGYNTEACVLKVALDMADRGRDIRVLVNHCYSSSGEKHHKRGVEVLKSLLTSAIVEDE